MRYPVALFGALAITVGVFLFMQGLIQVGRDSGVRVAVYEDVQVVRPRPRDEPEPEPREAGPEAPAEEPQMDALETVAASAPAPVAAPLEMPPLAPGLGALAIGPVGERWSAPLGGGSIEVAVGGRDAQGFIEVVPFDTRRPNVPAVAWHNRISGWVLVAFNVTPGGRTRNIRVLDASPRGVFEESVVSAVGDWRYHVSANRNLGGDVVLTQKVEVLWENYPQNLPNVD